MIILLSAGIVSDIKRDKGNIDRLLNMAAHRTPCAGN